MAWAPLRAGLKVATTGRSKQPAAVRHRPVKADEHDLAGVVGEAQSEDLRHELADLARREIDHRGDLAANQLCGLIVPGDLRRAFLHADLRAEVDLQLDGRLARPVQRLGGDNGADSDVNLEEVVEGDAG